jgi:hypothetical protein
LIDAVDAEDCSSSSSLPTNQEVMEEAKTGSRITESFHHADEAKPLSIRSIKVPLKSCKSLKQPQPYLKEISSHHSEDCSEDEEEEEESMTKKQEVEEQAADAKISMRPYKPRKGVFEMMIQRYHPEKYRRYFPSHLLSSDYPDNVIPVAAAPADSAAKPSSSPLVAIALSSEEDTDKATSSNPSPTSPLSSASSASSYNEKQKAEKPSGLMRRSQRLKQKRLRANRASECSSSIGLESSLEQQLNICKKPKLGDDYWPEVIVIDD